MKVKSGGKEFECRVAGTSWEKFKGLMLSRIRPTIFIFEKEKRWPFHTFFMLETIEMIFVDSGKKVVDKIIERPWRVSVRGNAPYSYVIELKEGEGEYFKVGEKIKF